MQPLEFFADVRPGILALRLRPPDEQERAGFSARLRASSATLRLRHPDEQEREPAEKDVGSVDPSAVQLEHIAPGRLWLPWDPCEFSFDAATFEQGRRVTLAVGPGGY
ncbi:MAG: hypothetical protein Kow00122_06930 [Thermoleophilia bacterium]